MVSSENVGKIDECLQAQVEEIEVLCSIYGEEWKTDDEAARSYSIELTQDNISVILYITLPETYPFESPPIYTLLAPYLTKDQKVALSSQLEEVYLQNIGQTVLFQWIENIREYLSSLATEPTNSENEREISVIEEKLGGVTIQTNDHYETPAIVHGEAITDRKSVFQGHAASVFSSQHVRQVLESLKENKKISHATHNIYAYRIALPEKSSFIQDCEDDGETQAGGRLLHLLQILNVSNVLVVVSRWYGGVHLGPDRFRHINNAARQVLEQAGLIENVKTKK